MTNEEIDKCARRIAIQTAYSAIENAAQDWLNDADGGRAVVVGHADEGETRRVQDLAYEYMMDIRVSLD